ncbi:MAG: caspase family protein [Notoacmeibacter sp.]|nr:caspase family protein [Notoacmeibacter sp.]MCC0032001.1 caspase family protein [Brucellaceae bacterium]
MTADSTLVHDLVEDVAKEVMEQAVNGRQLVFDPGYRHVFSLKGSGAAVSALRASCETGAAPAGTIALNKAPANDEVGPSSKPGDTQWNIHFNTDFPGHDIVSGLKDKRFSGIEEDECGAACIDEPSCRGYTYFRKTCFLKDRMERAKAFPGARSAVLERRPAAKPKAGLPGPVATASPGILSRDQTEEQYIRNLRSVATKFGGSCENERAKFDALAKDFQVVVPKTSVRAGQPVEINWSGNSLTEVLPVWLMATSDTPVRFSGVGSYALGPDAIGPFGIETDRKKTRGIVALYAPGAGNVGTLKLVPLTVDTRSIDLVLVSYLRACQETVELSRQTVAITVEPDQPELVVRDEFDLAAWKHEIPIPEFRRILRFNDDRILLVDDRDESEILEREGQGISLSPTQRFVSLKNPSIVIDVVDGKTVAEYTLPSDDVDALPQWMRNDSFAFVDTAPWGQVDLSSLFHDGVKIIDQNTGPSCCTAQDEAVANVDTENNLVLIFGKLGHLVAALQNGNVEDSENAGSGYAIKGGITTGRLLRAVQMMAPATAVSLDKTWGTAIGPRETPRIGEASAPGGKPFWPEFIRDVETKTAAAQDLSETILAGPIRGLGAVKDTFAEIDPDGLKADLARVGILLASSVQADSLWETSEKGIEGGFLELSTTHPFKSTRDAIDKLVLPHRLSMKWSLPAEDDLAWDCVDYIASPEMKGRTIRRSSRFDAVHHFKLDDRDILIIREVCDAGATFGSLRQETSTSYLDTRRIKQGKKKALISEQTLFMGNSGRDPYAHQTMRWKIYGDRLLLGVSMRGGLIKLVDLETGRIQSMTDLKRRSLMADATLTEDLRNLVQVNGDGSFSIYRLEGSRLLLDGRVVDREVAVWTADYRFDATVEGGTSIFLRFPGINGEYALEQFDKVRRVAGLSGMVLADQPLPSAEPIHIPPRLSASISEADGTLTVKYDLAAKSQDVVLDVYQDAVLTHSIEASSLKGDIAVPRLPGARWISVIALDKSGHSSIPIIADLGPGAPVATLKYLSVGVDKYDDPEIPDLTYAASDAALLSSSLDSLQLQEFKIGEKGILLDAAASQEAILRDAEKMFETLSPGDHAIFFFAGHGVIDREGTYRIALPESRLDDLEHTALEFAKLTELAARSKGRVTILVDACHAGAAGTGAFANSDDVVSRLKGLVPPNITIISASRGRELSEESHDLKAGLFTRSVADVLSQKSRFDQDGNGRLEMSEFYRSVRNLVSERSKRSQNPWIARNRAVGEFSMF